MKVCMLSFLFPSTRGGFNNTFHAMVYYKKWVVQGKATNLKWTCWGNHAALTELLRLVYILLQINPILEASTANESRGCSFPPIHCDWQLYLYRRSYRGICQSLCGIGRDHPPYSLALLMQFKHLIYFPASGLFVVIDIQGSSDWAAGLTW